MFRYLTIYLVTALSVVLLVAAFNIVIDPYRLFGSGPWRGINQIKPYASDQQLIGKALLPESSAFDILILGNSRALIGLDPESTVFGQESALNMALAGKRLEFIRHYAKHAVAVHKPKLIILGLDFQDFLVSEDEPATAKDAPTPPGYSLSVTPDGQPNPGYGFWKLKERFFNTVSLSVFFNSISTLFSQRSPYPADLNSRGFMPQRNYIKIAADEGYYSLFKQRVVENMKVLKVKPKSIFWRDRKSSWMFEMYEDILSSAKASDIRVITIIFPYHADYLRVLEKAGLSAQFEEWKRQLVDITGRYSADSAQLWDFSGYSTYTTEPVPAAGDRKGVVRWYWEGGHFKKELGDKVLARILDRPEMGTKGEDFGVLLTKDNIEAHLEWLRQDGAAYAKSRPEAVQRVDRWLAGKP